MFTGKLFLGLRGGKDIGTFSKVNIQVMTNKICRLFGPEVLIVFADDELGKMAAPVLSQTLVGEEGAQYAKILPTSTDKIYNFADDDYLDSFTKEHGINNIWIQTDSRTLTNLAKERILDFKFEFMKTSLVPIVKNQILCIDFGERIIEKIF